MFLLVFGFFVCLILSKPKVSSLVKRYSSGKILWMCERAGNTEQNVELCIIDYRNGNSLGITKISFCTLDSFKMKISAKHRMMLHR